MVNYYDLLMPLKQILTTPFQENHFFWHPQLDPFVKFYCIFNALVRPNLQRWTGFDVLIIFGVKFWWFFSFFETSLALLEAELAMFKDWAKSSSLSSAALCGWSRDDDYDDGSGLGYDTCKAVATTMVLPTGKTMSCEVAARRDDLPLCVTIWH